MLNSEDFKKEFDGAKGIAKGHSETIVDIINVVKEVAIPVVALAAVAVKVFTKLKK